MSNIKLAGIAVKMDDSVGSRIAEQARGDSRVAAALINDLISDIRRELVADTKLAIDFLDQDLHLSADLDDDELDFEADFDLDELDLMAEIDELIAEDDEEEEEEEEEKAPEDSDGDEEKEGISEMGKAMKRRKGKKSKDPIKMYVGCMKPTKGVSKRGGKKLCKTVCYGKTRSGKMRAMSMSLPAPKSGSCKPLKKLKGKSVKVLSKPPTKK